MWEAERLERVEADKIWEELNGSMNGDTPGDGDREEVMKDDKRKEKPQRSKEKASK